MNEEYYTYLWLRHTGTPYYAGKGKGRRGLRKADHRLKCPPRDRIILQYFASEEDAYEAEKLLVAAYGRIDLGTGCLRNLTDGGDRPPLAKKGRTFSSQGLANIVASNQRKRGKKFPEISLRLKGRPAWNRGMKMYLSPEARLKMRLAKLGKVGPNFGVPMREEQKKRISATLKGRPRSW